MERSSTSTFSFTNLTHSFHHGAEGSEGLETVLSLRSGQQRSQQVKAPNHFPLLQIIFYKRTPSHSGSFGCNLLAFPNNNKREGEGGNKKQRG